MYLDLPGARVERSADGQAFLFEERYGFVYLLDGVGAALVERLLAGEVKTAALVELVQQRFDVPPSVPVMEDLEAFLEQLRTYGLLV